jgi:hypothetical protein
MKLPLVLYHRIRVIFHVLGLSCIGGALFLQALVFSGIVQQGYFAAVERNSVFLGFEIVLTIFAIIYFVYIYQRLLRSVR